MLANTLTITIDGVANVLTRVNQDNFSSYYVKKDAVGEMKLQVRHSVEATSLKQPTPYDRHNVIFSNTVYATPTTVEKSYTISHTMRIARASDPIVLEKTDVGFATLLGTIRAAIVAGEP